MSVAHNVVRHLARSLGVNPFYANRLGIGETLDESWQDIEASVDFRPTDKVLDVGCAEGLVTLEIAKRTRHVVGIDKVADRIHKARRTAERYGVKNVDFVATDVCDYELGTPDIVTFLSVLGGRKEGIDGLRRVARAAKRQIVIRAGIGGRKSEKGIGLADIARALDEEGFDYVCAARGELRRTLIIANRRGTDAKLNVAPPLLIVPAELSDNPLIAGVPVGDYKKFEVE